MLECWTVGKGALIVNDCCCHCCRVSLLYRCACCYVLCILCCRLWASSNSPFLIFPAVKRKLEAREHRHLNYSWLFLYELHLLFYSVSMGKINFTDTLKFPSLESYIYIAIWTTHMEHNISVWFPCMWKMYEFMKANVVGRNYFSAAAHELLRWMLPRDTRLPARPRACLVFLSHFCFSNNKELPACSTPLLLYLFTYQHTLVSFTKTLFYH